MSESKEDWNCHEATGQDMREGLWRWPAHGARRRTSVARPRTAAAIPRGSGAGTAARARARAGRSRAGSRSNACHPVPTRRRARCRGHADGAAVPSPRCAAPAWRRCSLPGAWDRLRCAAASRPRCRTTTRTAPPCSGTRLQREEDMEVLLREQIGLRTDQGAPWSPIAQNRARSAGKWGLLHFG